MVETVTDRAMSHGICKQECGQVSGSAWGYEPESLHCFSPGRVCLTFLSLQTVLHNVAEWGCPKKLQILHAESRNCFSGPISKYLEKGIWSILGQVTAPGPMGWGRERSRAEIGEDTQHNHSLTRVWTEVMGAGENRNPLPWDVDKIDHVRGRGVTTGSQETARALSQTDLNSNYACATSLGDLVKISEAL